MSTLHTLRLGTRKSLLAWTQSTLVAESIEAACPGTKVELVGIVTKGDQVQNIPLSKIEGKEFFVKEIDEALLEKRVDFTVHSYKDLSTERPAGICLGAVPKREDPRDIVLFSKDVLDRLGSEKTLVIGTSSPRRLENLPAVLEQALPHVRGRKPKFRFEEIRGNVNTRLNRARLESHEEDYLDGVVLALAGLTRLMRHPRSREEVLGLLDGLKHMVMPLSECPTAPAQGALAIECRDDDARTRDVLAKIHDHQTAKIVDAERAQMLDWGGGCHQRFGITGIQHDVLGSYLIYKGLSHKSERIDGHSWECARERPAHAHPFDGYGFKSRKEAFEGDPVQPLKRCVFVANAQGLSESQRARLHGHRVWVSGLRSWGLLASHGVWVEGCCESLGVSWLSSLFENPVLDLPPLSGEQGGWSVLTHEGAVETWPGQNVEGVYRTHYEINGAARSSLAKASHVFWASGSQFDHFRETLGVAGVVHSCGPGKTAEHLRNCGIEDILIFPSVVDWRRWIGMK